MSLGKVLNFLVLFVWLCINYELSKSLEEAEDTFLMHVYIYTFTLIRRMFGVKYHSPQRTFSSLPASFKVIRDSISALHLVSEKQLTLIPCGASSVLVGRVTPTSTYAHLGQQRRASLLHQCHCNLRLR
ncbi:hypothetical protein RIF29_25381 [Crotalaria pallida]|uniref:Secreted protein n=1 Tax=Crotalaria pallida TaxID=3830 RepID=A0AAN9EMA8_CROPI